VEGLGEGRFACYAHNAQTLELIEAGEHKTVECAVGSFEIVSFVPIERDFAAIGLIDKFNSSKAVQAVTWRDDITVEVGIRDGGNFVAYSSRGPSSVRIGAYELPFDFDANSGRLAVTLPGATQQMITIRW
jgi:raffinose synthase